MGSRGQSTTKDSMKPRSSSKPRKKSKDGNYNVLSPSLSSKDSKCETNSKRGSPEAAEGPSTDVNGNFVKGRRSRTIFEVEDTNNNNNNVNDIEPSRKSRSLTKERNLNPFLDSDSRSRSRENRNLNPFLEPKPRSPSRSKSRSKSHEKKSKSVPKVEFQLEELEVQCKENNNNNNFIESVNTSIEGTPVILSREGSMIRIVDEETGEIFFKKRSNSRLRDYGGRVPVFVPRQSFQRLKIIDEPDILDLESNFNQQQEEQVDISNNRIPDTEEDIPSAPPQDLNINPKSSCLKVKKASSESLKQSNSKSKLKEEIAPKFDEKKTRSRPKENTVQVVMSDVEENGNKELRKSKSRTKPKPSTEKPSKTASRKTKVQVDKDKVSNDGNPFLRSHSRSKSHSDKRLGHDRSIRIPDEIFEKIFSYLNTTDMESCSQVCRRWKKLTDPNIRGPMLFVGKSFYGHYYPKTNCKKFVAFLRDLELKIYRPYEMQLRNVQEFQMNYLCKKLGHDFRSSVRHMVTLHLVNNQLKWKTLILLLQSFVNLRTLSDTNSLHFSSTRPLGSCFRNKQNWKKEMKRQEFVDLKYQLKRLKSIKISRLTIDQELVIYLNILTQGARNVEDFELILGPWETCSKSNEDELCSSLQPFIKALNLFFFKNSNTLKNIRINWSDKNYIGYFQKFLETLDKIQLPKLTELSLQFDKNSLKNPRNLMKLRQFLELHCAKCLRKVTISKLPLGEAWYQTAMFIDELMVHDLFSTVFNFEIVLSDCFGFQMAAQTLKILRFRVFKQFITDVHISIESEKTQSLSQLVGMQINDQYPRVKSVLVTFDPTGSQTYPHFRDMCIDIIVHNYPNLTELRISDRLVDHREMFNRIAGSPNKLGVSMATLENKDIRLLCTILVNLKVLKLWIDLSKVDDHGITGIHQGDINSLREDDVNYTIKNFGFRVNPNFSCLRDLEELSLRGLGQLVTNISAKFGFEKMERLKVLELFGDIKMDRLSRRDLRRKLKDNGTILRLKHQRS